LLLGMITGAASNAPTGEDFRGPHPFAGGRSSAVTSGFFVLSFEVLKEGVEDTHKLFREIDCRILVLF
ncbi:MAG: hypothetical protein ACQKBT_09455, partial [Puniceicoccales bacterium]